MKSLKHNPFFYLSLILGFAVVFEVAGIVSADWTAPTQTPPGGNPAQPIDTSDAPQTKIGGLTVMNQKYPYGVKMAPGGNLVFGPVDTSSNSITPQAEIAIQNGVLSYTNDDGATWQPIGSGNGGSIGTWPISIPTATSTLNGFFGFKLTGSYWSGFDLSGDPGNRLILGVSSAQVSSGSNVFDIEDTSSWTHMMEIRANGSILARAYEDMNGNPIRPLGTLCGLYVPPENGYSGLSIPCGSNITGPGPTLGSTCPAGYTDTKFGKGILAADDLETCVYYGYGTSTGTGEEGTGGTRPHTQ